MRIKKGQQEEENIDISKTFDNIAARNLAIEALKDGDLVKVLDASGDPNIQSGWAIYRFSKEGGLFDLVEKEEKEEVGFKPDYITTTEGVELHDRSTRSIVAPMSMRAIDESVEILEDFDFAFSVINSGNRKGVNVRVIGKTEGFNCKFIPVNTKEGLKFLSIGNDSLRIYGAQDDRFMHWGLNALIVDSMETSNFGTYSVNNFPDGKCLNYNSERDGMVTGRIPIMIVRCEKDKNGSWDSSKISAFKLWKNNLKTPTEVIKLDLETKSFPNIDGRDSEKETLYNGQLVKVVDAIKDSQITKGWATYRYVTTSKTFDLISCEFPKINLEGVEIPTQELDLKTKSFPNIDGRDSGKETLYNGQLVKVVDAIKDSQITKGWATYRYIATSKTFELISCEFPKINLENVEIPTPVLTLPNNTYNAVHLMIADKANLKDGEIIKVLDARGHDAIASEMWATFRFNKVGETFTLMSSEFPVFPTIPRPDKMTIDYIGGSSMMGSIGSMFGFRSDMRILRDFDWNMSIDYNKLNFTRIHGTGQAHIPIKCSDGIKWLDVDSFSISLDTIDKGKTVYYNISTSYLPTSDNTKGAGKSIVKSSKGMLNTIQSNKDTACVLFCLRINIPLVWGDFKPTSITAYKLWKKSLGSIYELIQYENVNP